MTFYELFFSLFHSNQLNHKQNGGPLQQLQIVHRLTILSSSIVFDMRGVHWTDINSFKINEKSKHICVYSEAWSLFNSANFHTDDSQIKTIFQPFTENITNFIRKNQQSVHKWLWGQESRCFNCRESNTLWQRPAYIENWKIEKKIGQPFYEWLVRHTFIVEFEENIEIIILKSPFHAV